MELCSLSQSDGLKRECILFRFAYSIKLDLLGREKTFPSRFAFFISCRLPVRLTEASQLLNLFFYEVQ